MDNSRIADLAERVSIVRKTPGKEEYCVKSEHNKDWSGGCYPSESQAKERLKEVDAAKHAKKGSKVSAELPEMPEMEETQNPFGDLDGLTREYEEKVGQMDEATLASFMSDPDVMLLMAKRRDIAKKLAEVMQGLALLVEDFGDDELADFDLPGGEVPDYDMSAEEPSDEVDNTPKAEGDSEEMDFGHDEKPEEETHDYEQE